MNRWKRDLTNPEKRKRYNEYMSEYHKRRYHRMRADIIKFLGGRCVQCGVNKDLEIDHRNPKEKKFSVSIGVARERKDVLWKEVEKCQLLCKECHSKKTIKDMGNKVAKGTHGTISSYRWCGPPKCQACKDAKNKIHRVWRKKRHCNSMARASTS